MTIIICLPVGEWRPFFEQLKVPEYVRKPIDKTDIAYVVVGGVDAY